MKNLLVLAAVLAFSVVAVGCGGSSSTNPSKPASSSMPTNK